MKDQKLALLEFDMGWSMWLTRSRLPYHIGRHPDNHLRNSSDCISRRHCTLDLINDELCVIDNGSLNGTILHNRRIRNSHAQLTARTCLLLSDMMLWITPCDNNGELISQLQTDMEDGEQTRTNRHGICLVDICDSMELGLEEVNRVAQTLRSALIGHEQDNILLLKHMGDGYLAVFDNCHPAINAAKRLLDWQNSAENSLAADIRVTLDSGMTYPTHGHDRAGMAICRAARLEKTQLRDMDEPTDAIERLKTRNRCLMTAEVIAHTPDIAGQYILLGKRRLKGFANELYPVYQFEPAA